MRLFNFFNNNKQQKQNTPEELFEFAESLKLKNPEKAFQYYLQAANMGHAIAMYMVGQAYLYKGKGADFNIEQAAYWYEQSAQNGYDKGMAVTAWFYMAGIVMPQSDEIAKQWMQKAIEVGDEKTAVIVEGNFNNFANYKINITALLNVAIDMEGIPPKENR